MLYVCDIVDNNTYKICDTDDGSIENMSKGSLERATTLGLVIKGITSDGIKKVDMYKQVERWKLLGVLDKQLKKLNTAIDKLFGLQDTGFEYKVTSSNIEITKYKGTNTTIRIPDFVDSLGESCFSECKILSEITLGSKIISLPDKCFKWCASLEKINLDNITSFGTDCFKDCDKLRR